MNTSNTGMTDILLEAGISFGENCVKSLIPSVRDTKILQAFINYGWNVNSRYEERFTFLVYATAKCSYECVKLPVEAGADVNTSADDGATLLTQAARSIYVRPDIVRMFINAGANVNAEFIGNAGIKSVLDIMFEAATSVASEREERQTFLRAVLPIMTSAGAKINPYRNSCIR